jgi:hypothetical protein
MKRGTLMLVMTVACLLVSATVASADLLNGGHKKTDFPDVSIYQMGIDPDTDGPLYLPTGPDGRMVEASPKQLPKNAILRVFVLVAPGSRDVRWVKLRIDGQKAFELKYPYVYDIETRKLWVGPHVVEAIVMTTEGGSHWETASAAFYVDAVDLSKYRSQMPVQASSVTRSDTPPAGQSTFQGRKRLAPPREFTQLYCEAETRKLKAGMVVDLYVGDQLVGRAIVDTFTRHGFHAVLLEGDAPDGADVVIPDQEVK